MSYKVLNTSTFRKEIKRLSKRHTFIKEDLAKLVEKLKVEPEQGVPIGKNCCSGYNTRGSEHAFFPKLRLSHSDNFRGGDRDF